MSNTNTNLTLDETITVITELIDAYIPTIKVVKGVAVTPIGADELDALQNAYRVVHTSRQGKVMLAITSHLLTAGTKPEVMAEVMRALTELPDVSSRVAKPTLTDDQARVIRDTVREIVLGSFHEPIIPEGADGEAAIAYIGRIQSAMLRAIDNTTKGGKGDVITYDDSLTDLLDAGIIEPGVEFTGTWKGTTSVVTIERDEDGSAVVIADSGETYSSLSAACKGELGCGNNGWAQYRTEDGRKAGTLRRS